MSNHIPAVAPTASTSIADATDVLRRLVDRLQPDPSLFGPRLNGWNVEGGKLTLDFVDERGDEFVMDLWLGSHDEPHYRRGAEITCSYRAANPRGRIHPAIDRICDLIFAGEISYLPLFRLDDRSNGNSSDLDHCGDTPDKPPAARIKCDLPGLSGSLAGLQLDELTCEADTVGSAIDLRARRGEQCVDLTVARRGLTIRAREDGSTMELSAGGESVESGSTMPVRLRKNPYASGAHVDIVVEDTAVDAGCNEIFSAMIAAIMEHEQELLEELSRIRGSIHREESDPVLLPIGRLSTVPSRRYSDRSDASLSQGVAVIYLSSPCFANCIFCGEHTTHDYRFSDVDDVLASIRDKPMKRDKVVIAGYEPLSHPGVPEMIAACRSEGVSQVELMTSGIPLANPMLVESLLSAGLTSVCVPLYSHLAGTNDRIMRKAGAFAKTLRGLDALARSSCTLHLHSLILRQNLADIDPLFDFVTDRWNATFVAAPVRDKTNFADTAPSYEEIRRKIQRAPVLSIPFCLYPRMRHHPDLDLTRPLQDSFRAMGDAMRGYLSQGLKQIESCNQCAYRSACLGIVPEQLAVEPGLVLAPFKSL